MDSTADGIISVGASARIDAANRAAARILRCDAGDLQDRPIAELVSTGDRSEFPTALNAALAGDTGQFTQSEFMFEGQRADSSVFPVEVAFTRQEGSDPSRLIVTLRDVTERRATEARLFQAQKMEAVGQLTPREREIMELVVSDLTSKEIARKLKISPRTVEHHRAHVMLKMQATSLPN